MLRGLIISDLMVCGSSLILLLNLNLIFERMWLRVGSDLLIFTYFIPFIKLLLFFFYKNGWVNPWSKINIEVAKIFFPFKLGWVSHNVSVAKISFKKKTEHWFFLWSFFFLRFFGVSLQIYLASTWCCMGYCFHIAGLVFWQGILQEFILDIEDHKMMQSLQPERCSLHAVSIPTKVYWCSP